MTNNNCQKAQEQYLERRIKHIEELGINNSADDSHLGVLLSYPFSQMSTYNKDW
jgi:hypothetical protein